MRASTFLGLAILTGTLAACAASAVRIVDERAPATNAYLTPERVDLGRQEYGPGYEKFPPIMTRRTGYPTQNQAEDALRRSRWGTVPIRTLVTKEGVKTISVPVDVPDTTASGVRLFACRPSGLDGVTGRVHRYRGPVVVCASDLLDANGAALARVPLNFYYWRHAWNVQDPRPGYSPAPWMENEPSPAPSRWHWLPGQDRY